MKKLIYILLSFLLLMSCRTSKRQFQKEITIAADTVFRDKITVDTLIIERIKEVSLPVQNELEIDNPCDSLGRLQPFSFRIGSGENTGALISKQGKLYYSLKLDSVVDRYNMEYRSKFVKDSLSLRKSFFKELEAEKQLRKAMWPWWLYIVIIGLVVSIVFNITQRLKLFKR